MEITMKSFLKVALMALAITLPTMTTASAGLIRKQSAYSVKVTLDRLENILKKKGVTVFARIDHAAGAMAVGQELAPTQVLIFGSPKMGTPLMTARREIGIDLPLKALVWRDENGKVWLAYNDPADLKARHRITTRDKVFAKMGKVLDALSNAAVK
jgi:uncharacterized protein (DUF302 family)